MIIAIDGPAGSGKGTIGRMLAGKLNFAFLDTGLIYRAATKRVMDANVSLVDVCAVITTILGLNFDDIIENDLRHPEITKIVPMIARIGRVREILTRMQRDFARNPPGNVRGAVLDGRDIGTVVCPNADVKLFVTADLEARAKRRYDELLAQGVGTSYQSVLWDMRRRDEQDVSREIAPLKPASDAILLDTTKLTINQACAKALAIVTTVAHLRSD